MSVDTIPGPRPAAVYIRVSTEDQAELSPDSQLEEIEKYARREGFVILREHIYIDGPAKIGLNQKHPTARGALV